MITPKTLKLSLKSLRDFAKKRLPDETLRELDERDECPVDIVHDMCSPDQLGIQLLFIPEDCGGFGGGAFDVYLVCEEMAHIDLGVATAVLATFLGSDPITVGATPEQKKHWLSRIAEEGILFAYGATEPEAGSDLGALKTTADPVVKEGKVVGYKINGNKQWISNGGIADAYSVLANTPGGPSWFIVEKGAKGFTHDEPENKHGIRLSNTAALAFSDVYVDADRLIGGVEGQGLLQAQAVFGYTRLMVAAFGLGAGWSALDRAIPYSTKRIQAGAPLSEKQGYTHKLIVPHVARLEAARSYIEETAERIDAGKEGSLNTEGAIAKYMATEAGNAAAEASIQALGGYGYTHEYMVEKIKRDVRITTIYEGTSEIMEMTIARDRWQIHLKTRGQHYHEQAKKFEELHARHPEVGADNAALALHALAEVMEKARGALVVGAASERALADRLRAVEKDAAAGHATAPASLAEADLRAPERIAIDYADAAELKEKASNALKALAANQPAMWKALRAQGIFRGRGSAPKVAFLYPGQGSQYVNMLRPLCAADPIVAQTFAQADRVMTPLLGKPLSDFIFVDKTDADAVAKAEDDLRQTAITQPAVLAADFALTRLLAAYGITPDFTMGHSLGEYGALVAVGGMPFADALEAVSARGREMTAFAMNDNGRMAAVFAPLTEIERILKTVNGYVVIANINSEHQAVIGGASKPVEQAMEAFQKAGYEVSALSVSHAFHTSIVAKASDPLRLVLERLHLAAPQLPIVANTNGEFYPNGADVVPKMIDILAEQVAAPVQYVKGLRTLYEAGARVFVEVGPKKALQGFAEDVLGSRGDVVSLFTNHPKNGDVPAFNQALCCLYAAGLGQGTREAATEIAAPTVSPTAKNETAQPIAPMIETAKAAPRTVAGTPVNGNHYLELGQMFADVLERGWQLYQGEKRAPSTEPVAITGAALGLPGTDHIFDDANLARLLRGDQFIDSIPVRFRRAMLDKHITRLVKSENGGAFETITDVADVIKLAGRGGAFDLESEFGISADRNAALDRVTKLAIAVGLDALRDAGIPLVLRYKTTTKNTQLPDRWALPESLRDDTGVIFASAFPGLNSFADEMSRHAADRARREQVTALQSLRDRTNGDSLLAQEIDRRIEEICDVLAKEPYVFDRRFLFRILPMGHSQFAEFIGARGPNTQINSACASTTQAVSLAEDWIRAGRCRRVVVVAADDVTSDNLIDWMGAGFLASGAAATDEDVEKAAVPFDKRRHGMIIGMGAAGLVVESAESSRERGLHPICQVLSAVTANSAFHGTRLDVNHISSVMEDLLRKAETNCGIQRQEIAPHTVFVSHETYTPARGGSAAAEIHALRKVFGSAADQIVIANTKGFTGHAMGAGVEDVLAVKSLETGIVPPVANFKEVDPELGSLNLSKGGIYPIEYALRLGAGFGSQISMTLLRWVTTKDGLRRNPNALGHSYRVTDQTTWNNWLARIAGHPKAELEVVSHTLRVRDHAVAATTVNGVQAPKIAVSIAIAEPMVMAAPKQHVAATAITAPLIVPATARIEPTVAAVAPAPLAVTVVAKPEVKDIAANAETSVAPKTTDDPVNERILALAVEKTGYPADMLDLDLDLEADLGVDTVKQAEMFAAIREIYNIPRDENRKLRDYPTLAHVIRFVHEKRPDLSTPSTAAPITKAEPAKPVAPPAEKSSVAASSPKTHAEDAVKERILALAVEKTGYPADMLDQDLDLEADLGVDTVKQAEMFAAIREIYNIPRDENRKLRDYPTLAHVIRFVHEKRPDLSTPAIAVPVVTNVEEVQPAAVAAEKSLARAASPQAVAEDAVKVRILALAVEKTGYPEDMLDLDLDLEADLGVDTVKQAEMFAAIREIYNIPRDENRKLRDYPTLAHVIRFVYEKRPDLAPGVSAPPVSPEPASVAAVEAVDSMADTIKAKVMDIVAEKTGYPKEMLDLDLDLEADLGIDTVKQAEMFAAIRATYNIVRDENLKLRDFPTLAHVIKFAQDRSGLVGAASARKPQGGQAA